MNIEALMLHSLCALGMLVSVLVLGAMLLASVPAATAPAAAHTAQTALVVQPWAGQPSASTVAAVPRARAAHTP